MLIVRATTNVIPDVNESEEGEGEGEGVWELIQILFEFKFGEFIWNTYLWQTN